MPEQQEIVSFIAAFREQFGEEEVRARLKADGCTPEQIDQAFRAVGLRDELETDSMSGAIKTVIAVAVLGLLGIVAALKMAPNMSGGDTLPKLSMQAGNVNLQERPGAPQTQARAAPVPAAASSASTSSSGSKRFTTPLGFSGDCPPGYLAVDAETMKEAKVPPGTMIFYPESLMAAPMEEKLASPDTALVVASDKEGQTFAQKKASQGLPPGAVDWQGAAQGFILREPPRIIVFFETPRAFYQLSTKREGPGLKTLVDGLAAQ